MLTKGLLTVGVCAGLVIGCADDSATTETKRSVTSKLLKAHAAAELPASDTQEFTQAVGGTPVDVGSWQGFVEGSTDDALFVMHLSGVRDSKGVAGLSIAFVEGAPGQGDLQQRLLNAGRVEVRFHNGSGVVSSHTFGPNGTGSTNAAHLTDPGSDALLSRAYNDAEALLRLPTENAGGDDKAKACMAAFLATVSASARCVDDVANTTDCSTVRATAVTTAGNCAGAKTANVLVSQAGAGSGSGSVHTQALGGPLANIFGSVSPLRGGANSFSNILSGLLPLGLGLLGSSLFGGGGGLFSPFGGGFSPFGGGFSPFGGGLSPFGGGTPFFGGSGFPLAGFGNRSLSTNPLNGFVSGEPFGGDFGGFF